MESPAAEKPAAEIPPALRGYYEKAQAGDAASMYLLGTMYCNGLNTRVDRAEGIKWIRRAAEKGHAGAKKHLEQFEPPKGQ